MSIFSGPSLPPIQPLPPTPTREDPEVEEARRNTLIAARSRRGRSASLLNSGGGQGLSGAAPTRRNTLLGATS